MMRLPPGAPSREMRWPAMAYVAPLVLRSHCPLAVVNRQRPGFAGSTVTHGTLPFSTRASRQLASIRPPWNDCTATGRQADCAGLRRRGRRGGDKAGDRNGGRKENGHAGRGTCREATAAASRIRYGGGRPPWVLRGPSRRHKRRAPRTTARLTGSAGPGERTWALPFGRRDVGRMVGDRYGVVPVGRPRSSPRSTSTSIRQTRSSRAARSCPTSLLSHRVDLRA